MCVLVHNHILRWLTPMNFSYMYIKCVFSFIDVCIHVCMHLCKNGDSKIRIYVYKVFMVYVFVLSYGMHVGTHSYPKVGASNTRAWKALQLMQVNICVCIHIHI